MALADYYGRSALAASQILAGFDEQRIRAVLESARVGLAIGTDAAECNEGHNIVDLLIRLLARLYPTLVIRNEIGAQHVADRARSLAISINPSIDFACDPTVEIAIGTRLPPTRDCPRIFVGSDNWQAFVSNKEPRTLGSSGNPFGSGTAASLGAANVFRWIFQRGEASLDTDSTFSVLEDAPLSKDSRLEGSLGDIVLVGAGAIGNAAAWALARVPMDGVLHAVDHESIDLGNLQRYALTDRSDEGKLKTEVLARYFNGKVRLEPHSQVFASFVASKGYKWQRMLLGLDSARDRRAAQASLPEWIANAWTQPGDLGVSTHDFLEGACVACLYLPVQALDNEDALIASTLGIRGKLMQIRTLLYSGLGVPRDLLEAISAARSIAIERLLPFEGRPIRDLYVEGFCGGAVIPIGDAGSPRQEVHVPLAHQSALAGILLASAVVRKALGLTRTGTEVTRLNILQPVSLYATQPAAKDPRGICICQDNDYREAYKRKYTDLTNPNIA